MEQALAKLVIAPPARGSATSAFRASIPRLEAESLLSRSPDTSGVPTSRLFMRVSKTTKPPRLDDIPAGGLCLSAFLILSRPGKPGQVLLGHLNPKADWEHIGALDAARAERNSKGWMLPASQLILNESPGEAARRILREQLGGLDLPLKGPEVFSEVYGPEAHWDLEFIFVGETPSLPQTTVWDELRFVDIGRAGRADFARLHEDILAHVGHRVSDYDSDQG